MKTNKVYVIAKMFNGEKCYFVKERNGTGSFFADVSMAKKFLDKTLAEIWASGYEDATVEIVKEGEVLK